jgi:2-polyprenyl-3-methyl-5-hydroxy-6-metoxy-1,4-benzoquinol methylase
MTTNVIELAMFQPSLGAFLRSLFRAWPQSERAVRQYYASREVSSLQFLDTIAARILQIAGDEIDSYLESYRWTCGLMMKCEMHYRRTGTYENDDFAAVVAKLYGSESSMQRYMRGLLVSHLLWPQHVGPLQVFVERFLPACRSGTRYLEIGPGHGLWMVYAAEIVPDCQLHAWDISSHSIGETARFLRLLKVSRPYELEVRDVCAAPPTTSVYDAVTLSQVLEVVANPCLALRHAFEVLKPDGVLFLNVPVRAAAPDHIRRWDSESQVLRILTDAGFTRYEQWRFPNGNGSNPTTEGLSFVVIANKR